MEKRADFGLDALQLHGRQRALQRSLKLGESGAQLACRWRTEFGGADCRREGAQVAPYRSPSLGRRLEWDRAHTTEGIKYQVAWRGECAHKKVRQPGLDLARVGAQRVNRV